MNIIDGAGIFIYPLGLCSILAVFLIVERLFALRKARTFPVALAYGDVESVDDSSVAGRVIKFANDENPDPASLRAYAKFELSQLERGMFILDIITAAAPLIGLLGTVVGLIHVFSNISYDTGMPDPDTFVRGIALALTTTMLGLLIAIPSLAGNSYLCRKIDAFAAKLDVLLEQLKD